MLVDAVYFQLLNSGIGRYWLTLIEEWKKTGFIDNLVVLDRGGSCPRIEGVTYRSIKRHELNPVGQDAAYLQRICDEEQADLFVSTYYTTPTRTPTIFMGYDMIPEVIGIGLDDPWWQQKRRAIQYALGHVMISQSSARDMVRNFPGIPLQDVVVAYCSVADVFYPAPAEEIENFRAAHNISRPYVLMVGDRSGWQGYKNGLLAFAGVAGLDTAERPIVLCIGGSKQMEPEYRALLAEDDVRLLSLNDVELRAAYSGAHALIYPSLYEGFGLPIAEALACGCPVITCANSSIPEVGGAAAIYVGPHSPHEVTQALRRLEDATFRNERVQAGLQHVKKFDAAQSARSIADLYRRTVTRLNDGKIFNPSMMLDDLFALLRSRDELKHSYQEAEQAAFAAKNTLAMYEAERAHASGQTERQS